MAIWEKYGLLSSGLISNRAGEPKYSNLPRATRFRMALEELGGLYALFGQYLGGRADLLASPYLLQLRRIRSHRTARARTLAKRHLKGPGPEPALVRVAPGSEVYNAHYEGRPIIIEVYGAETDPLLSGDWDDFTRQIRILADEQESPVTRPRVMEHFREWLLLSRDADRKRTIISNLTELPAGSLSQFPTLISGLQSKTCLVYERLVGTPLEDEIRPNSDAAARSLRILIEGYLEQALLVSLLDAEVRLENFVILDDGRLGFSALPILAPVPVEWHYELLQYLASTVAGNSARALHMLARMTSAQNPYAAEQHLLRELSGLQPELKINVITPETVTLMENYWRALSQTRLIPPPFLELFHRQWTIMGEYNGTVAPSADLMAESLWPVLGRILRYRFSEILNVETGKEWLENSGLLFLNAARQVQTTLEQVRDNDLAMIIERQHYETNDERMSRRTSSLVRSAILLVIFLLAVQFIFNSRGGATEYISATVAAVAAIALAVSVARID